MSSIDIRRLKSVNDDTIPFETHKEPIGTTEIKFDTMFRFESKLIKQGRIVNKDSVNVLQYKTGSALADVEEVPVSSDDIFDGWFSKIFITPNAVTGKGFLELDLVRSEDAYQ